MKPWISSWKTKMLNIITPKHSRFTSSYIYWQQEALRIIYQQEEALSVYNFLLHQTMPIAHISAFNSEKLWWYQLYKYTSYLFIYWFANLSSLVIFFGCIGQSLVLVKQPEIKINLETRKETFSPHKHMYVVRQRQYTSVTKHIHTEAELKLQQNKFVYISGVNARKSYLKH